MKKFLLFALCAIASVSAFAEPFSIAKYNELAKKDHRTATEYAYKAEIAEKCNIHARAFTSYIIYNYIQFNLSKQQIASTLNNFKGKISDKDLQTNLGRLYARYGFDDEAIECYNKSKYSSILYNLFNYNKKNSQKMWKYGKMTLLTEGGWISSKSANSILTYMFRYKPATVAKEEQVEFLSKLSQMYPIPGTDFNQWKSFMGFVGFKYKALTGKELF